MHGFIKLMWHEELTGRLPRGFEGEGYEGIEPIQHARWCFDPASIIGAVVGIASKFIGGGSKSSSVPAPPPIPEPAVAPDPDDKKLKNAKRRKASERRQRSGRLSTINTDESQTTVLG